VGGLEAGQPEPAISRSGRFDPFLRRQGARPRRQRDAGRSDRDPACTQARSSPPEPRWPHPGPAPPAPRPAPGQPEPDAAPSDRVRQPVPPPKRASAAGVYLSHHAQERDFPAQVSTAHTSTGHVDAPRRPAPAPA
jgi:hypothetical protein